jgi:D-tyrosyl-tRNA(Tyr) deacylase
MRALVQRVTEASVSVDGEMIGEIGAGLMILVCAMQGDDEAQAEALASATKRAR